MHNDLGRVPTSGAGQLSVGAPVRTDRKACEYDLSNAGKGYLPRFSLSGKATYQSDITRLPVEIPGIDVETAPKDQYQVMLELQQTIWDGRDIRNRNV